MADGALRAVRGSCRDRLFTFCLHAAGLSYIFAQTGRVYVLLFALGAAALALAFTIEIVMVMLRVRRGDIRGNTV